ncbi:unnamed protein product [Trichobilharzia regenti]|nr:unnamed protein product [Trichobilharzia regenti]
MLNTLKLIVSRVDCGSMNTRVSSKYSDHDSSAEDDPVSAWFASRQPLKSFVPPNAYEAYMTIAYAIFQYRNHEVVFFFRNRASAFRDLYSLVCESSPSVLKSNLC